MNLPARFRDWWFAPVVSRLDVLIAATGTSPLNRHSVVAEVQAASDRVQAQWHDRIEATK